MELFDTREHRTYTEEEPNSLAPTDVPPFVEAMRMIFLQHYAFTFVSERLLLVRRSQTIGDEVMPATKTNRDQRIQMAPELVEVLRWRIDEQLTSNVMRKSELLFPAIDGGFRSGSWLDKPFT